MDRGTYSCVNECSCERVIVDAQMKCNLFVLKICSEIIAVVDRMRIVTCYSYILSLGVDLTTLG
jgi:hypothetical protein